MPSSSWTLPQSGRAATVFHLGNMHRGDPVSLSPLIGSTGRSGLRSDSTITGLTSTVTGCQRFILKPEADWPFSTTGSLIGDRSS